MAEEDGKKIVEKKDQKDKKDEEKETKGNASKTVVIAIGCVALLLVSWYVYSRFFKPGAGTKMEPPSEDIPPVPEMDFGDIFGDSLAKPQVRDIAPAPYPDTGSPSNDMNLGDMLKEMPKQMLLDSLVTSFMTALSQFAKAFDSLGPAKSAQNLAFKFVTNYLDETVGLALTGPKLISYVPHTILMNSKTYAAKINRLHSLIQFVSQNMQTKATSAIDNVLFRPKNAMLKGGSLLKSGSTGAAKAGMSFAAQVSLKMGLTSVGNTVGRTMVGKMAGALAKAMKILLKKMIQKMIMFASSMLLKFCAGPLGWVSMCLDILGLAGMLLDFWDPNNEEMRMDMKQYNDQADHVEGHTAWKSRMYGKQWPPICSVQTFFPIEFEQATNDVLELYNQKCTEYILQNPDDDPDLTALIMYQMFGIPEDVYQSILDEQTDIPPRERTIAFQEEKYANFIKRMIKESRVYATTSQYNFLIRRITENSNREFENAKQAPFWYFAMSIPTAFYSGAVDVTEIPATAGAINYSNLTSFDIRVSEEMECFGERYIEVIRAKIPYSEERVRCYKLDPEKFVSPGALRDAGVPELPDMAKIITQGEATYLEYKKKGLKDNMIYKMATGDTSGPPTSETPRRFGFRDDPDISDTSEKHKYRAPDHAQSRWLAMCCFQQFLLQLAQSPGVWYDFGAKGASHFEGERWIKICVFSYRGSYYRSFQPRPWHEPRFVSFDAHFVGKKENAIFLNEAATHRYNEVFAHQRAAGKVIAEYRGIPPDAAPFSQIALWTDKYPDVVLRDGVTDENHPTPKKTRIIKNTKDGVIGIYKEEGRLVFERVKNYRLVKAMTKEDFDKINNNFSDKKQGWEDYLKASDINISLKDLETETGDLEAQAFYKFKSGTKEMVFYNGNTTSLNPWMKPADPVIRKSENISFWPFFDDIESYKAKSFVEHLKAKPHEDFKSISTHGIFEVEVGVKDDIEKMWTNAIGRPDPEVYPYKVRHIKDDENVELSNRVYSINVRNKDNGGKFETVFFSNYDGFINPDWKPIVVNKTMARKRMVMLPINSLYQYCTSGMQDDNSISGVIDSERRRANKECIYENYVPNNSSGVPYSELSKGYWKPGGQPASISFSDYNESLLVDGYNTRGSQFMTFDPNTRRCYIKPSRRSHATKVCQVYMGELYRPIEEGIVDPRGGTMETGECYMPWYFGAIAFFLGNSLTKVISRGLYSGSLKGILQAVFPVRTMIFAQLGIEFDIGALFSDPKKIVNKV